MPLYDDGPERLRFNLKKLEAGERAPLQAIGFFTELQFLTVNEQRLALGLHPLEQNEVVFIGRHLFASRSVDGYSLQDMIEQIQSALSETSVVSISRGWSRIDSASFRSDGYGNTVIDRGILEMTARKPRAELFSVIPKGDRIKPKR